MRILAWPARKNAARNPFQKLLYDAIQAETGTTVLELELRSLLSRPAPEILHVHWPDVFLALGKGWKFWLRYIYLRGLMLLARLRGIKVIWTAHNLQRDGQRNGELMASTFWPWFLRRVDAVIYMTRVSAEKARQTQPLLRNKPSAVIPHGDYLSMIGALPDEEALPVGPPQILFFGALTRYKNAHKVLRSFLKMEPGSARLRISGAMSKVSPDKLLLDDLQVLPPERASEVFYEDRFLPEGELVEALRAADLVVFPYFDVLNSGAAIFALSVGRPILASDNPLFRELQEAVGPEWIRLIDQELDGKQLAESLEAARSLRNSGRRPDLSIFDWGNIARDTVRFYREVCGLPADPTLRRSPE